MSKKTFKKTLPILVFALIVAMVVSILPSKIFAESNKYIKSVKVEKLEKDIKVSKDKNIKYISIEEAIDIAMKKVNKKHSEVTDYGIALLYDEKYYTIEITTTKNLKNSKLYVVEVDAITGKVRDVEVEKIKVKDIKIKTNNGRFISKYEAKVAALKEVDIKKTFITGFEIHLNDKTPHYLVEVKDAKYKYLVKIDAETAKVLESTKELRDKDDKDEYYEHEYKIKGNSDKINKDKKDKKPVVDVKYISKEEAIKIALKKIGKDAKLDEIELEKDDNPPKYEVEMYDDKYEYEIEIHAISGAILKFEREAR